MKTRRRRPQWWVDLDKSIRAAGDVDGAVPATGVYRLYGLTIVDAWTGHSVMDPIFGDMQGLKILTRRAGRPIDIEIEPRKWMRLWPDGTRLPIREPASMARRRALHKKMVRNHRRTTRAERRRRIARAILRALTPPSLKREHKKDRSGT